MNPTMPHITIENDSSDNIMANSGTIAGFNIVSVVWCFGSLPGSILAKYTGVDTSDKGFTWVLASYEGKIIDTYTGSYYDLPEEFKSVMSEKWDTPESLRIAKITADFEDSINDFDWDELAQECEDNQEYNPDSGQNEGLAFLGTVFSLMPSGKFYTPWANSNVTEAEAEQDELFNEVLERIAESHDMFVCSGEGDPCDIFVGKVFDNTKNNEE